MDSDQEPKMKGVGGAHLKTEPVPFDEATSRHVEFLKAARANPVNAEYERLRAEVKKKGRPK
jgi:hypothetical protein